MHLLLPTKLSLPPVSPRHLPRPRVSAALLEARFHRLTILQAGAGYGKSTALRALTAGHAPAAWYQVTKDDADPLTFLLYLGQAIERAVPGFSAAFLHAWDGESGPLPVKAAADALVAALAPLLDTPLLLVLDDVHLGLVNPDVALLLDRLIGLAPADLHFVLASRLPVALPNLSRWKAQGEVLQLDQRLLAFRQEEITHLFEEHYGCALTPQESADLYRLTEGWAIGLHLIWQSVRSGAAASLEDALQREVSSLEGLFDVLAHEVLEQQPEDVRRFLVQTAALQDLTPAACNAVRAASDSAAMLTYLRRQELFIFEQGDGSLRYHPIFHRFLRQQASDIEKQEAHRRAAAFFRRQEQPARAVYHLLKARDFHAAGEVLETYGAALLSQGRLDTLSAYLDALPPEIFHTHPVLMCYLGDLARLHSHFQEALNWYRQAEAVWRASSHTEGVSRALRGQARVYLDTVNPSAAESLLEEALRLSDGIPDREARARLYELLAENKLNAGKIAEAEDLRQQAALHREGPSDAQLLFRVLLRTGRLDEARRQLEAHEASERAQPVHTPRAHRETPLLLSLIYAFQGEPALALEKALAGRERGVALESPFVTAVGHMRAGHARAMMGEYPQARRDFEAAIEISRSLSVPRLQVEAHWGLCRVYGYQGDLPQARRHAEEGIRIAEQAGDEWIASLIRLTMGAALTLAQRCEESRPWLQRAAQGFHACSDPFGADAARLWLALNWFTEGHTTPLETRFPDLLEDVQRNGYDFLFTRPTLLGLPDERAVVPLLLWARAQTIQPHFIEQLLQQMGLEGIQLHPGYRLRVRTLGGFQVWRGAQPIPADDWQRASARALFQVLLTFRQQPLERDQICEYLWPEVAPDKASGNFKVALNALYKALEPHRNAGQESAFVLREGSVYALRPGADLWLDAQAFLDAVQRGGQDDETALEEAVRLYQGEYLPEARYEPWAETGRKFLAAHFLRAADRLCAIYLEREQAGDCLALAERILAQDNCWERAYRHLMRACALLDDRGQVARAYRRCVDTLRAELDVSPAEETVALYHHLMEA